MLACQRGTPPLHFLGQDKKVFTHYAPGYVGTYRSMAHFTIQPDVIVDSGKPLEICLLKGLISDYPIRDYLMLVSLLLPVSV